MGGAEVHVVALTTSQKLGWALGALSVFALAQSLWAGARYQSYVRCQADWSQTYALAAQARGAAADEDRAAMRELIHSIITATARPQTRAALEHYDERGRTADEQRRANPLPALPDAVCR